MPDWVRPDRSNVIFVQRIYEGVSYLHGSDTGRTPVPELFEWAKAWSLQQKIDILIPREPFRKTIGAYKVSIYGPDDQFRKLYAEGHSNVEIID